MSGQGAQDGEPRGHDWWARLYDPQAPDTGRARGPGVGRTRDTVDDRYASVARTLGAAEGSAPAQAPPVGPAPPLAPAPGMLPLAEPASLAELVPDTVLEETRYGAVALRAAALRGAAAREAGRVRGDALLVARFGTGRAGLVLVAVATGAPADGGAAHRSAREACHTIGDAVGRDCARIAEDLRADRRGALQPGLHRLTARALGRLRAQAAAWGLAPGRHTAHLRCLLLPADPHCRTRVCFGAGAGGLLRLRGGTWQDVEPPAVPTPPPAVEPLAGRDPAAGAAAARDGFTAAQPAAPGPAEAFRFRVCAAEPGDVLLLCSTGLAEPLRADPAFAQQLAARWDPGSPGASAGLAEFLTDLRQPVDGHEADRTAVALQER